MSPSTGTNFPLRVLKCTQACTLFLACAVAAQSCFAEPMARERRTVSAEFSASQSNMPAGGIRWESRWFLFPVGCEYVSHKIDVLDEIPTRDALDSAHIMDRVRHFSGDPDGKFSGELRVIIGAYRPNSLPAGPVLKKVKVSVVIECEESAWPKLKETFGIKKYP